MKKWNAAIGIVFTFLAGCSLGESQPDPSSGTISPDLEKAVLGAGWKGDILAGKLVEKDGAAAVEFEREDANIIWLDGYEFTEGVIEFDVKGKSEPVQNGFVGVAFRVVDQKTYDAVYFRTFNFGALDPVRNSHAVQYISHPEWPWFRLREEKTGQFEQPINPAPDGDLWFHAKIVLENRQVSVYVNNAEEPSLVVPELTERTGGSVGLWCYGYGVISNLEITPAK